MSQNNKADKMRERWHDCEIIANLLVNARNNITKQDTFCLYNEIKSNKILEGCLSGDAASLDTVIGWFDKRFGAVSQGSTRKHSRNEVAEDTEDTIRLALWFIKKVGGPEKAIKAIQAASVAIKKLES